MRTIRIALVLALALVCVVPAAANAARYYGRAAGNDPDGSGLIPKHSFVGGDDFPVQSPDREGSTPRSPVCPWVHGKRQGCRGGRTGRRNHWSTIVASSIAYPGAGGKTIYRWYLNGERDASWSVHFNVEPE